MTTDLDALYDSEQWMIRMDRDGVSFGEFRWAPIGEWTAAPDWTAEAECEGGLFGQGPGDGEHSYCKPGTRLVLCETRGPRIRVDGNKIKVPAARIVAVDGMIPARFFGHVSLDLGSYPHPLPALTQVGGDLFLGGYPHPLPALTQVGGYLFLDRYLHLGSYPHPLPALTQVGGNLFLGSYPHALAALTQVGGDLHLGSYPHPLPALTQVGGYLDLGSYPHPLPALTQVGGDLFLDRYPHPLAQELKRRLNK
jgi:hypothetical protein